MSVTQNSVFNSDTDSRKFSFVVSFLILPEITHYLMIEAPYRFQIDRAIADCDSGTFSYTVTADGVAIAELDTVPISSGGSVETIVTNGIVEQDQAVQIQYTNVALGTNIVTIQFFCTRLYDQT